MAKLRYENTDKFFRHFGAKVQEMRKARGWTQDDMASKGFNYRHYQKIEARKSINVTTLLKIADTFGITLEKLFENL